MPKIGVMLGSLVLALLSIVPGGADAAGGDARLNDLCFVDAEQGLGCRRPGRYLAHRRRRPVNGNGNPPDSTCTLSGGLRSTTKNGWAGRPAD